jgi:hypothetical protein
VTTRLKRICEISIYAVAGIALVLVLLLVGASGAAEPWQEGASVMLPSDTGITVMVNDKYGIPREVDSINILTVHQGMVYLTRKGDFFGRFELGAVTR